MSRTATRRLTLLAALLAPAFSTGCGGPPSNLSPTPDQDPARFERARADTEELIRKNREAERKAMRRFPAPETNA